MGAPDSRFILAVQLTFQTFYIFEFCLKIFAYRLYFFTCGEWKWNLLDAVLAIFSVYDAVLSALPLGLPVFPENSAGNGLFLRLLRLFRVTKILRAFRIMRFFPELRVMLNCIVSSITTLFWCSATLAIFYYIFAIVFMHATVVYLADPVADTRIQDALLSQWGSVFQAMVSLFQASTGGMDWGELGENIRAVSLGYFLLLLFFIGFMIFAVLNILTGVFVDKALEISQDDCGTNQV